MRPGSLVRYNSSALIQGRRPSRRKRDPVPERLAAVARPRTGRASLSAGPQGLPARSAAAVTRQGRSVAEDPRSGLTAAVDRACGTRSESSGRPRNRLNPPTPVSGELCTRRCRTHVFMKQGYRVGADAGTEVGFWLVPRARRRVGPGVPRAPRIARPDRPVSAPCRFRTGGLHASALAIRRDRWKSCIPGAPGWMSTRGA